MNLFPTNWTRTCIISKCWLVAWLAGRWPFAVNGFWGLWDHIHECALLFIDLLRSIVCLTTLFEYLRYIASNERVTVITNWKGFRRKRSLPNFKVLTWHSPGETEENHEKNNQNSQSPGRKLNPGPSAYEAWVLTTRSRRSVSVSCQNRCHSNDVNGFCTL
jgi:hypothetical protein